MKTKNEGQVQVYLRHRDSSIVVEGDIEDMAMLWMDTQKAAQNFIGNLLDHDR